MVNNPSWYRGKRLLILTRVSTQMQGKNFSHSAQERHVRAEFVAGLGMYIADEERHVVHSNYTGLEYQYNEALDRILKMAADGEFDVFGMDVLDRGLGRKTIARELYRMQLLDYGVRTLTTDPTDHADDDSFEGQAARLRKGLKAEEEVLDMVRRTSAGRREKALGNPEMGIPPQVVGSGSRHYGYKFVTNAKGTRIGYELNFDVIFVEPDGTEWTEVKVVIFIFESAANGISLRKIAAILNEKGIPDPGRSKGTRKEGLKEDQCWQHMKVGRVVEHTGYYGEDRYGKTKQIHVPGKKRPVRRKTLPEEQIIVPVPAIVSQELWEKANRRVSVNRRIALRNNKNSKESLLRGGFARCAYCRLALTPKPRINTLPSGKKSVLFIYNCPRMLVKNKGKCSGCAVSVDLLDAAVMEYIEDIIKDPPEIVTNIQQWLKDNPIQKHQHQRLKSINKILSEQETLRANLSKEMRKKDLSEQTVALLGRDLKELERQEQEARRELEAQQTVQQQHENLDRRIAEFHATCTEWREKLDDPEFKPAFHFYQEAVIFFGISVKVWRSGTKPRWEIYSRPPEIAELLSSAAYRQPICSSWRSSWSISIPSSTNCLV